MIEVSPEAVAILGMVGSVGAAIGITKVKVNRTEKDLAQHVKNDSVIHIELVQRLTRIETKIDDLKFK